MPVEVEDVVVAGPLAKVLAELVEGRRAKQVNVSRELLLLDQLDERARNGAIAHVTPVRPGDHQQDVHAIAGKRPGRGCGSRSLFSRRSIWQVWAR